MKGTKPVDACIRMLEAVKDKNPAVFESIDKDAVWCIGWNSALVMVQDGLRSGIEKANPDQKMMIAWALGICSSIYFGGDDGDKPATAAKDES